MFWRLVYTQGMISWGYRRASPTVWCQLSPSPFVWCHQTNGLGLDFGHNNVHTENERQEDDTTTQNRSFSRLNEIWPTISVPRFENLVDIDWQVEHKPVCLMASDKRACDGLVDILDIFKRDAGVIPSDWGLLALCCVLVQYQFCQKWHFWRAKLACAFGRT